MAEDAFLARIDEHIAELREMRSERRSSRRDETASLEDLVDLEESRAGRKAFLAVVDEIRAHGLGGRD